MSNLTNHTNRGRRGDAAAYPAPAEVRALRDAAGLTQAQAGALLSVDYHIWQNWESGARRMHPAFWELAKLKLGKRRGR
jgi:putative transcriptional regulator